MVWGSQNKKENPHKLASSGNVKQMTKPHNHFTLQCRAISGRAQKTSRLMVISSDDFFQYLHYFESLNFNDYVQFLAIICYSCMAFWSVLLFYLTVLYNTF